MSDANTNIDKQPDPAAAAAAEATPAAEAAATAPEGNQPADGVDGGDGAESQPEGTQPESYRPEGMPDHYAGENDQETIDNLFKAVDGYRKDQAKKAGVPEALDDYKIELPEDLASKVMRPGEDGKDPVFEDMRAVFHENGIPVDKAAKITEAYYSKVAEMVDKAEEAQAGVNLDFEYKELGGTDKAKPMIEANSAFIDGLVNQGTITEADAADMKTNLKVGEGLAWMDKLRVKFGGGEPIPASMDTSSGTGEKMTQDKLNEMMKDPRYWKDKDPAYIAKVTEGFQQIYKGA